MSVDPDLARRLKATAAKVKDNIARRDHLVDQALTDGGTLREVAQLAGVSHQTVVNIIERLARDA